jgi:ATP-binding protein involved in chromosome partitioning
MAARFAVPVLGEIPLVREIRVAGDQGTPIVMASPEHPQSQAFRHIAEQVVRQLEERARRQLTIH